MKKIKIKNLKILLSVVIWMLCPLIFAEAAEVPEYESLTIYNRDSEIKQVSGTAVYSKNQNLLSIDKFVNGSEGDNYDTEDVNRAKHRPVSGQELFGYSIVSYFPSNIGMTVGESYVVIDQLNEHLVSFPETLKIYSVPSPETAVKDGFLLTEDQHYVKVFEQDDNTLTVSLTEAGMDILNERNTAKADRFLLIKFDCQLSEDAQNGVNLYNKATLSYKKGTAASGRIFSKASAVKENSENLVTVSVADEPEVHTGQIAIVKVNAKNEEQKLANAKFGISQSEAEAKAGEYIDTGTTDENGNLVFRGLSYGQLGDDCKQNSGDTTYWLTEIEAPQGYRRVRDPIEVKFQYQQNDDGEFYFAKFTVYNQPTETKRADGPESTDGPKSADRPKYSNGIKTGDTVSVFLMAAILIISLTGILITLKKKKESER